MAYQLGPEDVAHQRTLLGIHRRNALLQQRQLAMHNPQYVPPGIVFGIRNALDHIARIKVVLREAGHEVEDAPEDSYDLSAFE